MRSLAALLACATLTAPVRAAVDPLAGNWKTLVVSDVKALLPAPPPNIGKSLDEIEDLKTLAQSRDKAAMDLVRYWNAGPPAYRWIQIAQKEVASHNLGGPAATRAMSLVAAAIYDSTVSVWYAKYTYLRPRPTQLDSELLPAIEVPDSPSYPSTHAATAAAAVAVLSYLFPDRGAALDSLKSDAVQSRYFAGTEYLTDISAGTELGGKVADQVIQWARNDGSDMVFEGSFPAAPGKWSSANPSFPLAGMWKPWTASSASQFRLEAPPAFDSAEFRAQVAAVKNQQRTVGMSRTAWVWQASFTDPWIDTINQLLFENQLDHDPPMASLLYAASLVSQHDATLACWDTKYTYLEERPIQADPAIVPLFATPAHPSFPSGHACASGAVAGVLSAIFPDQTDAFTARANEAGLSTFYAGIHYPIDVDRGLELGRKVAAAVAGRFGIH
ncbi:MAG: phosphatase PAP2 family protein [Bryobacterales bacterium]|nr:phosphatase PAP2 family protein [Bryobacterales bacterium]